MPKPRRRSGRNAAVAKQKLRDLKEQTLEANREIVRKSFSAESPRDIEDLYTYESESFTNLCKTVDNAKGSEGEWFAELGLRLDQVQFMREDQKIAQSWIDWYKHKRQQDLDAIQAIENNIPAYPEFQCSHAGHPCGGDWVIYTTCTVPEITFRIRQATHYSRVLFTIFCSPDPAPAPGEPLPANLLVPDLSAPVPRRYSCRNYVFPGNRTYSEGCARLVTFFLNTAVREKITSDLLPFVPLTN